VTQFADGATAGAPPYVGWDASWKQLQALPRATWSFAFHAGAQGHSVTYPDNPGCTYFYPCQLPTETAAQYEARVSGEVGAGRVPISGDHRRRYLGRRNCGDLRKRQRGAFRRTRPSHRESIHGACRNRRPEG
jgi:hypothetical protein